MECKNVADCLKYVADGIKMRSVASTKMNEQSSRSHSVLKIKVTIQNKNNYMKTIKKLNEVWIQVRYIYHSVYKLWHKQGNLNQELALPNSSTFG